MTVESESVDPIHQFHINPLLEILIGGVDFSFTNASLFMAITVLATLAFLMMATNRRLIVPGRMQSVAEMGYEFVASTLRSSAGSEGMRFFPLVFSLFLFVLVANLFGMVPYFFTVTSQIVVTFSLAMLVILTVTIYGFMRHGTRFLGIFVPHGVPGYIIPLVTTIEVISFLSRPVSLSVRLFANMLAGHIALKVFAGFVFTLGTLEASGAVRALGLAGAVLPLFMAVALTALEFLVAFIQAYVFTILTCMYLNDAVHPGH